MKFSGTNFQRWQEFDLEITGLTVVTGESNLGKSAIYRALYGLLRNELSERFVRLGQKKPLSLTLDFDGHKVIAERSRDGSSKYTIDGEDFAKLARKIPDDLKKLGFDEITVGEHAVDPMFAVQDDPEFLLNRKAYPPAMLNAILGAFGGTEKLEAGKKEANLRITHKNGEAKTLSFEIAEAEQRKATLETLSAQSNQIAVQIHSLESSARLLEHRAGWTRVAHQRLSRLAPLLQILSQLDVEKMRNLQNEASNLQNTILNLQIAGRGQHRTSALELCEHELGVIGTSWSEFVTLYKKVKALQETAPLVEENEASTAIADATKLNDTIGLIENLAYEATRREQSIRLIGQVEQLRARVEEVQHERLHIEAQQADATKVQCPKCGTEF